MQKECDDDICSNMVNNLLIMELFKHLAQQIYSGNIPENPVSPTTEYMMNQ